jgi:gamma-glutamyltranspeptidase/glutathione hydrolase
LASKAAMTIFDEGGNAIDAAIAAGMMLSVVDGFNSGLGGGCFVLAKQANGKILAIDGRETAPAAATEAMFIRNGEADPSLSQTGALASGVPGAIAAYAKLSDSLGTGRWKRAANLAAEVAEQGFEISTGFASKIRSEAKDLGKFDGSRSVFFDPDGKPLTAGATLIQRDLAGTLREIALNGPRAFYEGRFAELTSQWMAANGGLISQTDLRNYRARERDPISTNFRGHQIFGFPPPSSGGVHVAQILHYVEQFELKSLFEDTPELFYHVVGEAMRLAFADRATFLGDPSFADVPLGLLDSDYLSKRGGQIQFDRRIPIVSAGGPPGIGRELFGRIPRHTTHFTTVDSDGNWVAITATINTTFGSKVVIPETGVVMNNQMDDFAIAPGVPNAFGLVGSEANAPAAGKRPLSSMSPTIVLKDGQPVLTCGAAGGPRIISATAQVLIHSLGVGASLENAMATPRIHQQWKPDVLMVEDGINDETVAKLRKLGHVVSKTKAIGTAQAAGKDPEGGFVAVGESRIPGTAMAK